MGKRLVVDSQLVAISVLDNTKGVPADSEGEVESALVSTVNKLVTYELLW
jgi:hypothetical protein